MTHLAKPFGVTLEDHNRHLTEQCDEVFPARLFVCQKYRERTGGDLEELVRQSVPWHDEGKKHPAWQQPCQADYHEFLKTGKTTGKHLRVARFRHEMASLEFINRRGVSLPLPARIAIGAHHGKLGYRHEDRWDDKPEFRKYWEEFVGIASAIRTSDPVGFESAIVRRYEYAGPRALLQLVDHRASATEAGDTPLRFNPFGYQFPHGEKRGVQLVVEDLWDDPFAILRAPTGAGKTDAALLWAQHQIDNTRADRVVIAMPTRFTANALSVAAAENLSATGLYHSTAWLGRDGMEQEHARLLETPITVTTIDHLCISLTGTREDQHGIFFNLAHACVIIDEADFYDDFTQQNIVTLLRALRLLRVPVLLMSATVPESARKRYTQSGFTPAAIFEDKTDLERVRCRLKRYGKMENPQDIEELLRRSLEGEPTIIYANTVKRAQAYYQWFRQRRCPNVVLYHSRFTEPHKVKIEKRLYGMLGREAWKEGVARGVAILTQIGELSVNISADLMISDLCPVDRLAQRAGRLARFQYRGDGRTGAVGELFLVRPYRVDTKGQLSFYPAPYGHYKSGTGWEMTEVLRKSNRLLKNGGYSAKRFVELVDTLYPDVPVEAPHVRANRQALENCAIGNWLILPKQKVDEGDDNTMEWKSRDIPPQKMVYVDYRLNTIDDANQSFKNWREFRRFQIEHGVQCHVYEFNFAHTNGMLDEVTFLIGEDDKETAWLVRHPYYLYGSGDDSGLIFSGTESD